MMKTIRWVVLLSGTMAGLAGCGGQFDENAPLQQPGTETLTRDGSTTLKYQAPGQRFGGPVEAVTGELGDEVTTATNGKPVVFFPRRGESQDGLCWQGLVVDSAGFVYPVANGNLVRLNPKGQILNGDNDTNFFANEGMSIWMALDEAAGKLYTAAFNARVAKFKEGANFKDLIPLPGVGEGGITLGRGPLAGSLIATDGIGGARVHRITLHPLSVKVFARGSLFSSPDNIASAPDGTLYVINDGKTPRTLVKITPAGKASVFAKAADTDGRRMVVVDKNGIVYWSSTRGVDRFKPNGQKLASLPGPADKPAFESLMGGAFDRAGNLYAVDNFECKKVYKYRGVIQP
jgi:hypothetical protein